MKIYILLFALIFTSCTTKLHRQTDRERDGFVGKVARVYISTLFPTKGKCPIKSNTYDANGNLTKQKIYTNGCGDKFITTDYRISADGKRISTTEGTQQSKTIYNFDTSGRISEETTSFNNAETLQVKYFFDEKGRIKEKIYTTNGTQYGKDVYEYVGENNAPAKFTYTDSRNEKSVSIIYTNYEFNSEGDWVKREETDNGKLSFVERAIEYYED
ncbi:MAG TPA: hypothetical protein PKE69_25340 [Pyrinomonadaceae bacterium]|nr:hypothetical protein [Pyrinomonadaceae bacterium]